MILVNNKIYDDYCGVPISICVGNKPINRIYTNVNSSNVCVYSNFQIENVAVHAYNKYKYSNTVIEESTNTSGAGENGKFRYSDLDVSAPMTTVSFRSRSIGRYDSYLHTANITTDNNYWNPDLGVTDSDYAGIDISSDGGFKRDFTSILYVRNPSTGFAEWPHPVLLNTEGAITIELSTDLEYVSKITKQSTGRITLVYNLIPKQHYYYRLIDSTDSIIKTGEFTTEGQIRMIRLDNVRNVRDMGGYLSVDGTKRFKYGKIFRGTRLEGLATAGPYTSADSYELKTNLNITKEIDLRGVSGTLSTTNFLFTDYSASEYDVEASTNRALVSPAKLYSFPSYYAIVNTSTTEKINGTTVSGFARFMVALKAILKSTGAVYLHCKEGRDRTGTFCAILEGICGVHGDGIMKDFELTTFWGNSSRRYEMLYWDCAEKDKEEGSSKWNKHYLLAALKELSASTATTIPALILDWFKYRYNTTLTTDTYRLRDDNGDVIVDGDLAILYILSKLMESVSEQDPAPIRPSYTFKVSYATNVSTDVKDGDETLVTVGSTATSGRTVTTDKTEVNLIASTNTSETLLVYSDLEGNLLNNPIDVTLNSLIVPKVKGNLMYTKYAGYQWCDLQLLNDERYRLYRKSNANFCASSIIWTTINNPLLFTIPSLANQSVSFEVVNPNSVKGIFKIKDVDLVHKTVSLNLDSNGLATYQPSYIGMVVFNFAKEEVVGYTTFTNSLLEEIQINYANVDAWSVPSVKIDTILKIGGINLSLVYYNGYVIAFRDNIGAIIIIDVESKSIVRQVPVTSVTTSSVHCNAATLMPIKYNNNDFFPMITLSGDGSIARVIRLAGANPSTVTASKVCDYTFKYNYKGSLVSYDGMVTVSDNNFYYLRWSQTLSKINIDLTDISNYVDRDIVANVDGTEISAKIVRTGLDITIAPSSRGDIFVSQYGPEPYYWNTSYSSTNRYYINGITLCSIRDGGNIVGHIPFYGIRFNQGEPDGITYAGNNVFYIVVNLEGLATLYRLTVPFPEF